MKLNHRDRVLLSVVVVVLVWVVGIWFFIVPAFQELGEKRDELNDRQVELSKRNDKIEEDKDLPQRIEAAWKKSDELGANFYEYQSTQNATDTVDKLLDDAKVQNSTMVISEYSVKKLKPFYYVSKIATTDFDNKVDQYDNVGNSSSNTDTSSQAQTMQKQNKDDGSVLVINPNDGVDVLSYEIELNFIGKYSDVQKFCENLSKNVPGSMILSGLSITDISGKDLQQERTNNSGSSSEKPAESKSDKQGVEAFDDNEIKGTININLITVKKLSKPTE